jgi:hypothetical protein
MRSLLTLNLLPALVDRLLRVRRECSAGQNAKMPQMRTLVISDSLYICLHEVLMVTHFLASSKRDRRAYSVLLWSTTIPSGAYSVLLWSTTIPSGAYSVLLWSTTIPSGAATAVRK